MVIKTDWLFRKIEVYAHVLLQAVGSLNVGCPTLTVDDIWGLKTTGDVGRLAWLSLFVDGDCFVVGLDLLGLHSRAG